MSGERKGLYAEISERDFEFFKILCGERDRELLNGSAERKILSGLSFWRRHSAFRARWRG